MVTLFAIAHIINYSIAMVLLCKDNALFPNNQPKLGYFFSQ